MNIAQTTSKDILLDAISSFLRDAPSSPFQVGYLAALVEHAEACGYGGEDTAKRGRAILNDTRDDIRE